MKNIYFLTIILIINYSCRSESEKANESFSGTWKLDRMEYEDSTGIIKIINDSEITLTFSNDNKFGSSSGFEIIGKDTIDYEYSIDYSMYDIDIMIYDQTFIEYLPLDAIGRIQVYHYDKPNKRTIEFYTNFEYDYLNKQKIYDTYYLYTKIGE